MKGINTNGIYDSVGLVESIIVDLNNLEVKGVANMKIIFDSIGKLDALKKNLMRETETENGNTENS